MESNSVSKPESRKSALSDGFPIIAALFILSGFSSLIYQVVWTRHLVFVFGSTTFATSTVLAVFMGGLALGSYFAGRIADKIKRPLLAYGYLEGLIGVWALLIPFLFKQAIPIYQALWQALHFNLIEFSLLRFAIACCILIVPTTAMGATLPLLSKYVTDNLDTVGKRVGTLYSVNTLGAVFGAALAGFVFLPQLGLAVATYLAAFINLLLIFTVLLIAPMLKSKTQFVQSTEDMAVSAAEGESVAKPAAASPLVKVTMLAFFVSGAIAMIYEVAWTRTLLMVIGSSTYAFSIMLTTFLTGIFLGSWIFSRLADKLRQPIFWFGLIQCLICAFGLSAILQFNQLPWLNIIMNMSSSHDPTIGLFIRFILASMVLMPITLCLGAIFPVVVKICATDINFVGQSVGSLYAANTFGAIVGSFLAGFLIIPSLGVEKTLVYSSVSNIVLGLIIIFLAPELQRKYKLFLTLLFLPLAFYAFMNPTFFERIVILSAQMERRSLMMRPFAFKDYSAWKNHLDQDRAILFYKDGASSTVGVTESRVHKVRSLVTNGHVDASDGMDMSTQILLSAFPLFVHKDTQDVAIVGWGSGVTIGTALAFPIKSLVAIELEPAVMDAAKFFSHVNGSPENDPRVKLEVNDGRNYLLVTKQKFDVIVSEPSNPWQAGVCNLFTKEYFEICKDRLKDDGVLSFWLQTMEIPPENITEILSGLRSVFKYVVGFSANTGNLVVLASDKPISVDLDYLQKMFDRPKVAKELQRCLISKPEQIAARIELPSAAIESLVKGASMNVDDTNRLEYAVAKSYESKIFGNENRNLFSSHTTSVDDQLDTSKLDSLQKADLFARLSQDAILADNMRAAQLFAEKSLAVKPNAEAMRLLGIARLTLSGDSKEANKTWASALNIDPGHVPTLQTRGMSYMQAGQMELARADFAKVLSLQNSNPAGLYHMSQTYFVVPSDKTIPERNDKLKDSSTQVIKYLSQVLDNKRFLSIHPDIPYMASVSYYRLGDFAKANEYAAVFLAANPNSRDGHILLQSIQKAAMEKSLGNSAQVAN